LGTSKYNLIFSGFISVTKIIIHVILSYNINNKYENVVIDLIINHGIKCFEILSIVQLDTGLLRVVVCVQIYTLFMCITTVNIKEINGQ
jgi:hypothetical protein